MCNACPESQMPSLSNVITRTPVAATLDHLQLFGLNLCRSGCCQLVCTCYTCYNAEAFWQAAGKPRDGTHLPEGFEVILEDLCPNQSTPDLGSGQPVEGAPRPRQSLHTTQKGARRRPQSMALAFLVHVYLPMIIQLHMIYLICSKWS